MGIFSWLGSIFGGKRKKKKQSDVDSLQSHPGSFESEKKEVAENRKLSDPKVISMDPMCDDGKINVDVPSNSESQIVSSINAKEKDEESKCEENKIAVKDNDASSNDGIIGDNVGSSEYADIQKRVEDLRLFLVNELRKMGISNEALLGATDKILLDKLQEQIEKIRRKVSTQGDDIKNLKKDKDQYKEDLRLEKIKREALQEAEKKAKDANNNQTLSLQDDIKNKENIISEKENLIAGKETEIKRLNEELNKLKDEKNKLKAEKSEVEDKLSQNSELEEKLANSEVGQLLQSIDDLENKIKQKDSEIETLNQKDSENALKLEEQEKTAKKKDGEINDLKGKLSQSEKDKDELNIQLSNTKEDLKIRTKEIEKLSKQLTETDSALKKAKSDLEIAEGDLNASLKEIETLSENNKKLENEKFQLSEDKKAEIEEKHKLSSILKDDISSLLTTYKNAADNLIKSLDSVFLKECNEDEEIDTVESMCAKICDGAKYVASEIEDLKEEQFNSTVDLKKAYKEIIADNIESSSFTEIARWWAYSRLPFVLDTSREDGRSVELSVIEDAYAALEQLLALAGYRYQLPILFVQNLNEGEFENLTGREQLNLGYQVPNATSHVEKIDRDDCKNVILDIVKLGYYEGNQLVKKTSVIVQ